MKKKLIPPDLKQCQAEKPSDRNFMSFGNHSPMTRCASKPTLVVEEAFPGPDGLRGSMSLCKECFNVLNKQMPGYASLIKVIK